jgi:muconolactone D-isomerase
MPTMEYLVTMTTHVPDVTPDAAVDDVRAREAARSRELAAQGHLLRLRRPPLPLDPWMTVQTTPLSRHPSDPAGRS